MNLRKDLQNHLLAAGKKSAGWLKEYDLIALQRLHLTFSTKLKQVNLPFKKQTRQTIELNIGIKSLMLR